MFSRNGFTFPSSFRELRREMDDLLNGFVRAGAWCPPGAECGYPALNVWDAGDALAVEAEVPGVRMADLEILAVGNELTIKGRRAPIEGKDLTFHRQERGTGDFSRVITLPVDVDPDRVEAVLRDGVLNIRLPKAESARPRKITVKTA